MSFSFWSTNGSRLSGIGGIAEEGFDVGYPQQGKVLRMKANDRAEVKQYMEEIPSLAEGAAEVDILRAKSHMVWEVFF
ncbi:uncharacterized protein AKAW2_20926A [Aspergillus luchuensis]|uniref:Uncharacterized protein n=1 Tax=Aspergillus kawachii TaxID=1069201 RepID=A0A7R7W483_ASPKA|nr:uncharacterized protein AKAW2_20926A [Aspergillus luchuensis]BCR95986.1 hypothetical protein AKAW2_20926A [Aspergillus luchuensis]